MPVDLDKVALQPPEFLPRFDTLSTQLRERFFNHPRIKGRITDRHTLEAAVAFIDAIAAMGHGQSVTTEVGLDQCFPRTAGLVGPMIEHGKAAGYRARSYRPAVAELVARLSAIPTATAKIIDSGKVFSTLADDEGSVVDFRTTASRQVTDMEQFSSRVYDESAGTYTDISAEMRSAAGSTAAALPATPAVGDRLEILFPAGQAVDKITVDQTVAASDVTIQWCTHNAHRWQRIPVTVADLGGTQLRIDFDFPTGFGTPVGLVARVYSAATGGYQEQSVTAGSDYRITTTAAAPASGQADGYLGQTSPSTDPNDYYVTLRWLPCLNLTDGTSGLTTDGDVSFDIPEEQASYPGTTWEPGLEADSSDKRRVLAAIVTAVAGSPTAPTLESIDVTATGGQAWIWLTVTQGTPVGPLQIGTHGGTADESFTFGQSEFVFEGPAISVDEGAGAVDWNEVEHLLSSSATDDDVAVGRSPLLSGGIQVTFGDGTNGNIPASSSPVYATYAVGGDLDGNLGANTVVVNSDGLPDIAAVWNAVPSVGWQEEDGATEASFELFRQAVEEAPRLQRFPITLPDFESFAIDWTAADGSSPVSRAFARVSSSDPKTVIIVVVGGGGAFLSDDQIGALEDYFNDPDEGVVLVNHTVDAVNYTRRSTDVTVAITKDGSTYTSLDSEVATELRAYLAADAIEGTARRFSPGGIVEVNKIGAHIYETFPVLKGDRYKVAVSAPASDFTLGANELPAPGTLTINGTVY